MVSNSHEWLTDPRGNSSRWIALCFAALFAVAAVAAALAGQGGHVTAVLGGLFVVSFNVAFGRRGSLGQVACALVRRPPRRG